MIVDANEKIRAVIKGLCQSYFSDIYESSNSQDAIDIYNQMQPDWTLLDLDLDGIDGLTLTRRIREIHPMARIVIMATFSQEQYRYKALQAGAVDCVPKGGLEIFLKFAREEDLHQHESVKQTK
jgi:CheY-like chemotaxis protein